MFTVNTILEAAENQRTIFLRKSENYLKRDFKSSELSPVPEFARIVTGVRRCGKSTLLQMALGDREFFYLNFDDPELYGFSASDFAILNTAIESYARNKNTVTLCFDEFQNIEGWETFVHKKLFEGYFVYVTGSNANLMSKELGTRLSGRHLDSELFPFSYTEFCSMNSLQVNNAESLQSYLKMGGFPEYLTYKNEEILKTLMDDILTKDISVRYGIKDLVSLKILAKYLSSNFGNLISGSRLSNQLNLKTKATVLEYMGHMEQSYLFFFVPKFDYSPMTQTVNPKKVYCIDTALAQAVSMSVTKNKGKLLENAVYLSLRRKTKNVWYYSEPSFECDFLYGSDNTPESAVQVCYELNEENRERELRGIVETCRKFNIENPQIVTFNQNDIISFDGMTVEAVDAMSFLSGSSAARRYSL